MSGVGEDLVAFDKDLCSIFMSLQPEEINTIRAPIDQRGKARLREAQVFITFLISFILRVLPTMRSPGTIWCTAGCWWSR